MIATEKKGNPMKTIAMQWEEFRSKVIPAHAPKHAYPVFSHEALFSRVYAGLQKKRRYPLDAHAGCVRLIL